MASALLAGCGGGSSGIGPSPIAPSTTTPVTASPATSAPVGTSTTPPAGIATATASPLAGATTAPASTGSPVAGATTAPASTASPVAGASTAPATTAPASTPTPLPVATPTAPAGVANFHPSDTGTTYTYAGSALTTYTRPNQYPSPEPTQTTLVSIGQSVTVTNPASFDGNGSAIDYHTVETDAQTAPASQTTQTTYDNYYAYTGTPYVGNFQYLGFTSTDGNADTVTATYGTSGALADELPETAGAMWTNPPTATISTIIPNGQSSMQQIAADGTYVTTIQYQNVNAAGPTTTASVTAKLDGSGAYYTPRLGTATTANYSYIVSAPSGTTIAETTTIPPAAGSTAAPTAVSTSVPDWIPTGFLGTNLATETDQDMGSTTLPSTCKVPSSFGTTANVVVQKKERVDPMLGQMEITTTTNYVLPNVGPACVAVDDVLTYYYDFTGQNGTGYFSGVPQQVSELQETLTLSAEQLTSSARSGGQRFATTRAAGVRTEFALAHIAAARSLERGRFLRSMALGRPFSAASSTHLRGIL